MAVNVEFIRDQWIPALRSHDYEQGRSCLHDKWNDTYCCLGVTCNRLVKQGFITEQPGNRSMSTYGEGQGSNEWLPKFRYLQQEWGRCTGKVYIDKLSGGPPVPHGWCFEKRLEYEDNYPRYDDYGRMKKPETYLRATWITFLETFAPPAARVIDLSELMTA